MATERTDLGSAELLKRIRDEINRKVEIPTGDWKTSKQWGAIWGLQQAQTNRHLSIAVQAGLMETKLFRIPMPTRTSYQVPHYREIKK